MADEDKLCCVFIDNSNLFIEGQKSYAKQHQFRVDKDTRFRIDYGKLMDVLVGDRRLVHAALYGSEPPPTDDLWKRIRERNIEVFRYKRDDKNCEKELDTSLTAHVTRKAMEMSQDYVGELTIRLTFIIVAGDGDYISAFKQVIQENLKLEVWAWKSSIAGRIKEFQKEHKDKISVHYLDGDDEKTDVKSDEETKTDEKTDEKTPCRAIHFINYRWDPGNHELPRERSIVIHQSVVTYTPVMLTTEVTNLIKIPCKYLELDEFTVIIIVLSDKFRATESIVEKCKQVLSRESPDNSHNTEVSDYPTYVESRRGEIPLLLKYGIPEHKDAKPCIFKFACIHGSGCNYQHTEEEKKHFEKHPYGPYWIGDKYKSKFCTNFRRSGKCRNKRCVYAHNLSEARCYICDPGGLVGDHWMDECKNKIE